MENHAKYEKFFAVYREVTASCAPIWEKLQEIAND